MTTTIDHATRRRLLASIETRREEYRTEGQLDADMAAFLDGQRDALLALPSAKAPLSVRAERLINKAELAKQTAQWAGGIFRNDPRTNRTVRRCDRALDRIWRRLNVASL